MNVIPLMTAGFTLLVQKPAHVRPPGHEAGGEGPAAEHVFGLSVDEARLELLIEFGAIARAPGLGQGDTSN